MAETKNERISIGYALPSKKVESFVKPSLATYAKTRGIDFIPVDLDRPLLQQGPFHCIVHKVYGDDWNRELLHYKARNPNVPIIDPPAAIQRLHNRISMLDAVKNLSTMSDAAAKGVGAPSVGIPNQILLREGDDDKVESLGVKFPAIAKPLIANGSLNSHQMSVVFNTNGLKKVMKYAPIVLQEFVNHGGVLFKVYVAGENVRCVQRTSLPDFNVSDHPFFLQFEDEGFMPFSQISNLATTEKQQQIDNIDMPPPEFVNKLAKGLREGTEINLFNFDLIRDSSESSGGNRYLIIDINYFPGFAKLPEFEEMLTDFFLDVVHRSSDVEKA